MAGIKEAMKRVMEHRNVGSLAAKGTLRGSNLKCTCAISEGTNGCLLCRIVKFIIVRLEHDGGLITQYDNESDIHIVEDLQVGDDVILMINSNWSASWEKWDKAGKVEKVQKHT